MKKSQVDVSSSVAVLFSHIFIFSHFFISISQFSFIGIHILFKLFVFSFQISLLSSFLSSVGLWS